MTARKTKAPASVAATTREGLSMPGATGEIQISTNHQEGTDVKHSMTDQTALDQAIAEIEKNEVGSTAYNGVRAYEQVAPGRWTPDSEADTPATISTAELVAEAKGEISVEQPEKTVRIPKGDGGVKPPTAAAWDRLVDSAPPGTVTLGDPYPYELVRPRPAWADNEFGWDGTVCESADEMYWRSRPYRMPYFTRRAAQVDGRRVTNCSYVVYVERGGISATGPGEIVFAVDNPNDDVPEVRLRANPQRARAIARALLAAADLIDPDGDFGSDL